MEIFTTHEVSNLIKQSTELAKRSWLSFPSQKIQSVESSNVTTTPLGATGLTVQSVNLFLAWPDWEQPPSRQMRLLSK